jgi:hypothetical protein
MTSTTEAPRAAPADEHHRRRVRSSAWPVAPLAVLGWFAGLLPWLVRRSSQGTFGTPWNPRNDLRSAMLPFHHQLLMLLLVVAVMAGVFAGCAPVWSADRRRRRLGLAALAMLGAALATGWSVAQTLAPDPDLGGSGRTADQVRLAFVALTVTGVVAGLVLGLAISLGGPALRAVAAAPVAVVGADWLGQLALGTMRETAPPTWLPTVLAALSGVVVGALLVATVRSRLVVRVIAWACALALLALTAAALTAARYVLEALRGTPVRGADVKELLVDGLQVFEQASSTTLTGSGLPPSPPLTAVLVAVVVGVAGTVLVRRTRAASMGQPLD